MCGRAMRYYTFLNTPPSAAAEIVSAMQTQTTIHFSFKLETDTHNTDTHRQRI